MDGLKIIVDNEDARQIITVCFKLGHKCNHKGNVTLHREMFVVSPL